VPSLLFAIRRTSSALRNATRSTIQATKNAAGPVTIRAEIRERVPEIQESTW